MTKSPLILMRASLAEEAELAVAKKYFNVVEYRSQIQGYDQPLVVARYSALPYYTELETDVACLGGCLINSYREHSYVADMRNWYGDFEDLTPKTWFRVEEVPRPTHPLTSYVLKGATNSRKHLWRTHMYATTHADIIRVFTNLLDDSLIGQQDIYVREFEPFKAFGEGINQLPITLEFRFFILDGEVIGCGYYWSEHADQLREEHPGLILNPPIKWVKENICPRLENKIRFVVVDVAKHEDGRWRLVELNDGQMSGLGCVDPEVLYSAMAEKLTP